MNAYIPVLNEQPPTGFVCNATWKCTGPGLIHGHTPPRKMPVLCPCVECLAKRVWLELAGVMDPEDAEDLMDGFVLGPVWIGHSDPWRGPEELVGVYRRHV